MFKFFALIKRKNGVTMEEFIEQYENHHAPLSARLVPNVKRYVRHYLRPYGTEAELPYDVVTEIQFDDRADFEQGMAHLTAPEAAALIAADEERLFDRPSMRFVTVEDRESELDRGILHA